MSTIKPPQSSWVAVMYTTRFGRKGNRKGSIRWKFYPKHHPSASYAEAIKAAFALGYGAVRREDGKVIRKG